jgi:hypothetical protein
MTEKEKAEQAKPTNPAKSLGDFIQEALKRAEAEREGSAPDACNCPAYIARREGGANMEVGPTVVEGKGNHINVGMERVDDMFVLFLEGEGVEAVSSNDGKDGFRFKNRHALVEFFDYINEVQKA